MPPLPLPDPSGTLLLPHARGLEQTALVPPARKRTGWIFLAMGLLAMGAVAIVVLGKPTQGRLLVNVTDANGAPISRVQVLVDGTRRCETAPCSVDALAGGAHEVKLLADGYAPAQPTTVAIDPGKDTTASFSLQSTTQAGTVKVQGNQPGVKLYVDDKEIGPLPQEVRDLSPGDHTIKLAGSDRYQPLEKRVAVTANQSLDLGTLALKVLRGKVTVNPGTAGARVYLVSGADRRELPSLPISVDIDTTKTWSLEATKPGMVDFKELIGFDDGQAEKVFVVTLSPKEAPAPVAVAQTPAPARPAPAAPAPAPAPAPAEAGEAFLNINSIPPSTCFLDGHSLGTTPRVHVSVKPGTHVVKFVNADQGLTKTVSVSVGAGETKPAVAKLN